MSFNNRAQYQGRAEGVANPIVRTLRKLSSRSMRPPLPKLITVTEEDRTRLIAAALSAKTKATTQSPPRTTEHSTVSTINGIQSDVNACSMPDSVAVVEEDSSPCSDVSNPFTDPGCALSSISSCSPASPSASATSCNPVLRPLSLNEIIHIWCHACLLFHCHSYDDALTILQELLSRPGVTLPFQARLQINVGNMFLRLQEPMLAKQAFNKAAASTEAPAAVIALGFFMLGTAFFELGNYAKAHEAYESCLHCFESGREEYRLNELGLSFVLRRAQVLYNRNLCAENTSANSVLPVQSLIKWTVDKLPADLVFEAPPREQNHYWWDTEIDLPKRTVIDHATQRSPRTRARWARPRIAVGDVRLNKPLPPLPHIFTPILPNAS